MTCKSLGLLAILSLAAWSAPAGAATFHNVDCSCDPATDTRPIHLIDNGLARTVRGCACQEEYTLGKFETKEFRFRCKSPNAVSLPSLYPLIGAKNTSTTCTIPFPGVGSYTSQSCTNWSPLSTDTIELGTICSTDADWVR